MDDDEDGRSTPRSIAKLASMSADPTSFDPTSLAVGVAGVLAAVSIPLTAYVRRPSLVIAEDVGSVHSRVEGNGLPFIRLLVRNRRWRRTASGSRVLVDHYSPIGTGTSTTLGCPPLSWTSLFDQPAGATIFSSWGRPIDFGMLVPAYRDTFNRVLVDEGDDPETVIHKGGSWQLRIALDRIAIADQREYLAPRPNGYTIRLTVGADDGAGRTLDVDVNWNGDAPSAAAALDSVQLAVRPL